jgi:hypothetical protein
MPLWDGSESTHMEHTLVDFAPQTRHFPGLSALTIFFRGSDEPASSPEYRGKMDTSYLTFRRPVVTLFFLPSPRSISIVTRVWEVLPEEVESFSQERTRPQSTFVALLEPNCQGSF